MKLGKFVKYAWVIDQYIFQASTLLFLSAACMLKGRREAGGEKGVGKQDQGRLVCCICFAT